MEASEQNIIAPCTDRDKAVLKIMDRTGWGLTVERIAEYTELDLGVVNASLAWLQSQGQVEFRYNKQHDLTYWYLKRAIRPSPDSPVCSICGKVCKNVAGLAIHQARAHSVGHEDQLTGDSLTMEISDSKSINFVQDLIARFATLPGAEISVTVKFSKGVDA